MKFHNITVLISALLSLYTIIFILMWVYKGILNPSNKLLIAGLLEVLIFTCCSYDLLKLIKKQ